MKISALPLLLSATLVAACATAAQSGTETSVPVRVRNDLTHPGDVTVRMVLGDGSHVLLGGVPPGTTRRLSFPSSAFSGNYHLLAVTGDGRTVTSRSFTLFRTAGVVWQLQRNELLVVQADLMDGVSF